MAKLRQYRVKAVVEGGAIIEFYVGGPNPDEVLSQIHDGVNGMIIKVISVKEVKV